MIDLGAVVAGLCVGLVIGLWVGESREAARWRHCACRPQDPVCINSDGKTFFSFLAADFYEHYHNPLAVYRFRERNTDVRR